MAEPITIRDEQGRLHCLHGPAVLYPDGRCMWYVYGKPHRADGPAVVTVKRIPIDESRLKQYPYDTELKYKECFISEWWFNGKRHRIGGPAVEWCTGTREWYVHGRQFTEREYYLYVDQVHGDVIVPCGKHLTFDNWHWLAQHLVDTYFTL